MDNLTVLTKEHIGFIRTASTVCFRYSAGESTVEVTSKMGARLDLSAGFGYRGYGNGSTIIRAFAMIHTPGFDREWLTVADLLRPGDTIQLDWMGDTNGYTKCAEFAGDADTPAFKGLYLDQMQLVIQLGKKQMSFQLCLSVWR